MSQQVNLLRKKLDSAINSRKELEQACKLQVDDLTQFIAKLSLVCKGLDLELDNRLAKYRRTIQKGADFEQLKPLLSEITDLVKVQALRADSNFNALHLSVEHAGRQLQRRQGLPDNLRRHLRTLMNDDLNNIKTTNEFVPVLKRLVDIYNRVLDKQLASNSADDKNFCIARAQEVQNLLTELTFEGQHNLQIEAIKERIYSDFNLTILVECCVDIIRIIVHSMSQERVSAQQFLFAINETLALLQNNLLQTVKRSHSFNSQIKSLNLQIEEKIRVINLDVEAANDIDTLKKLITEKMSSLNNDLKTKEQVEQKENSQLVQTIKEMASRVNELEHKTEQYQTRLAEQKFKNLQDYLTLLPNRSAFDERFTLEYNKFQREHNDLCLVIADIDRFKSINDSYGHSAGDKTLQTVAKALKNAIRVTDFIARYGGEEFVLIMPHSRLEQVLKPLEKLRITVKSIPFKFKQQPVSVTISFGVTQLKQGDSMAQAFDRADEALYEAKRQGRDRIVVK